LDEHLEEEETVGRVEGESVEQSSGGSPEHSSEPHEMRVLWLKGRDKLYIQA